MSQVKLRYPRSKGKFPDTFPRALSALSAVESNGLCHRCGTCVGICPTRVLSTDFEGYPQVENLDACTDCQLCIRACPGEELNYNEIHSQVHGCPGDLSATHGHFIESAVGHSTDPQIRERSTSGGIVTAILLYLLRTGKIDGAIVTGSDEKVLWKGKAQVARSEAEILAAMKSKYAIEPVNSVLAELRKSKGRFALVGLPCQIHGFRKMAAIDKSLAAKVTLTIGLFCHAAIEHDAFKIIWNSLGRRTEGARRFISRIGKHPGTPHLELQDGSLYPVYFGQRKGYRPSSIEVLNVIYRLFTPERCLTCFDSMSDLADISVGDPWMAPPEDKVNWFEGWSFVLMRTPQGVETWHELLNSGAVRSIKISRAEALNSNRMMAREKRHRAFRIISNLQKEGRPAPLYSQGALKLPPERFLSAAKTRLHILSHFFCGQPSKAGAVLGFMLGKGYWLFWLNHKRRALRTGLRDLVYYLRRKTVGRAK